MKSFDLFDEYNEETVHDGDFRWVKNLIDEVMHEHRWSTERLAKELHVSMKSVDRWLRKLIMPGGHALLALMRLHHSVGSPRDPEDRGDRFIHRAEYKREKCSDRFVRAFLKLLAFSFYF